MEQLDVKGLIKGPTAKVTLGFEPATFQSWAQES